MIVIIKKIINGNFFTLAGLSVFPFELLGLTSSFDGSFGGGYGDWFVSCMFFCYFCYPLLTKIIREIDNKKAFVVIYLICMVAPVTASVCDFSWVYPNPFYRMLQFALGMMLAKCINEKKVSLTCRANQESRVSVPETKHNNQFYIGVAVGGFLILVATVSFFQYIGWGSYASYEIVSIPCWAIILYALSRVECRDGVVTKTITYLASISYAFYLSQCYCYILGMKFCQDIAIPKAYHNIVIGCVCLLICFVSAVILTKIDAKIKELLRRKKI